MSSRNSSSRVILQACVDIGVIPKPTEGFCPDSLPHSMQGWRERLLPFLQQQLPPVTGGWEESFNKASDDRIINAETIHN